MKIQQIESKYWAICDYITAERLKDALDVMSQLLKLLPDSELHTRHEQYADTYKNLLKYTVMGIKDPEQLRIFTRLLISVLELNDKIKYRLILNDSDGIIRMLKFDYDHALKLTVDQLLKKMNELTGYLQLEGISATDKAGFLNSRTELIKQLFIRLLLTDIYHEEEEQLLTHICYSDDFFWYEKCLVISSVSLSLFQHFDVNKIYLLADFYESSNIKVKSRALTGLLIGLFMYDKRLNFYPEIKNVLKRLKTDFAIEQNIQLVVTQLIRAKETEQISQRIREEIIPEVVKIAPKFTEKLDLESILSEDNMDDSNPEWESFFEETPNFFAKIEELTQLQMQGSDIFLGAFSILKHFPFFKHITNWFLPYNTDNQDIWNDLSVHQGTFDIEKFLKSVEKNQFFCNSDKYSFCLNLNNLVPAQRNMMVTLFNYESEALHEFQAEDDMLQKSPAIKIQFTQYIHDLYRFFKLCPSRSFFSDIFDSDLDIWNASFINQLIDDLIPTYRTVVQLYFEKSYYDKATTLYLKLIENGLNEIEIFQKLGYCYQKMGDYTKALDCYLKADLFEGNKLWNIKKIAFCYLRLNQPTKALEYYLEVEKQSPKDLYIQANIGRCYLDMEEFSKALEFYFKVEYNEPSNIKVMRPIAWCCFVTGKFDSAKRYINKVIELEGSKHDYILLGNIELCLDDLRNAALAFRKSLELFDEKFDLFLKAFDDDRQYLARYLTDSYLISYILDYIRFDMD